MEAAPIFLRVALADDERGIALRCEVPFAIEFESGAIDLADVPNRAPLAFGRTPPPRPGTKAVTLNCRGAFSSI